MFTAKQGLPWGDSMRSVFERALNDKNITAIILTNGKTRRMDIENLYPDTLVLKRFSLKGIWYFLRSKVCFISHSNKELYSMLIPHFRHILINLWHGIPIKSIDFAEATKSKYNRKFFNPYYRLCNYFISSSHIDRLAMSGCMMQNPNNIWITGLPRNDLLFEKTKLPPDLKKEEEAIKRILNGRKLILYAPTFRDWEDDTNPLSEEKNIVSLLDILKKYNAALGIRKHPFDTSIQIADSDDIIDCSSNFFTNPQILLRNTDILISDYSGIWIDYLLMDRPIIGFCYDYDRYMKGRSFLYDYKAVFAGEIANDVPELISSLEESLEGNDKGNKKREFSQKIFFTYADSNSTDRVFNKTKELI